MAYEPADQESNDQHRPLEVLLGPQPLHTGLLGLVLLVRHSLSETTGLQPAIILSMRVFSFANLTLGNKYVEHCRAIEHTLAWIKSS